MIRTGFLVIHEQDATARFQALDYMERYADIPCDYADATLLVAAEDAAYRRIFSLDRHSYAYRLADGSALQVIP